MQFDSTSEQQTAALGTALAAVLEPGCVVALNGELGAGKTLLVQTIAAAMGVDRREVTSPTFVLIQQYAGRIPLYHFDAYRVRDTDEFLELGAGELMESDGVCLIEWADRVADVLPDDLLRIEIEMTGETSRRFCLMATGLKSESALARLSDLLGDAVSE